MKSVRQQLYMASFLIAAGGSAVAAECAVSASALMFGEYYQMRSMDLLANSTVSINCSAAGGVAADVSYQIKLGAGSGNQFATRQLQGANGVARYNIYVDASLMQVWGDGSESSMVVADFVSVLADMALVTKSHTAYGRMLGGQSPPPDEYSDQLLVEVVF